MISKNGTIQMTVNKDTEEVRFQFLNYCDESALVVYTTKT